MMLFRRAGLVLVVVLTVLSCASAPPASSAPGADGPPSAAEEQAVPVAGPAPASTPPSADPPSRTELLPVDPLVTVGTLPTGLTYYIRENDEPRNRAFLRLAVNAGSILEDSDQLGLAHFVEHMAFNGTENFSGNDIIAFLEGIGMQFGPDINAHTGFDETVYELTIPTDDPETFREAFSVLLEWANRMTLSAEEIDKERGVIIEEWRSRRSAAQRIAEKQYPVLFANSRYAERLPIGDIDLIASFPPEAARRFYRDWYRPDLSSIIAVGDFDATQVETMITELFGEYTAPENPRPRTTFDVPEHDHTKIVVASDPEAPYADVSIITKRSADELATEEDYRELLVGSLFTAMLNDRLDEISRHIDAPFIGAGVSSGRLVRSVSAASLSAAAERNAVVPALEALIVEARRVTEHGFTETELDRAKADRLRAIEQAYRERDNTSSASLADEYVRAFLQGEAIPGIPYERSLHERLLPGITLEEVNALAADYLSDENRVVAVSTVESDELLEVHESDIAEALREAGETRVAPYVDPMVRSELLGSLPAPGQVVSVNPLDAEDIISWKLSNGANVVFKATDFRSDQVVFSAFSPGGTSLVDDAEYRSAQYAATFVENMGYGEFSPPDLERFLSGTAVSVTPYIGNDEEGLSGGASAEDLDLLFQLIHLKMASPRRDPDAFAALKRQFQAVIANQEASPQYQFNRLISDRLNVGHPRSLPIDADGVDSIDLDAVMRVYADRFSNAADFTFVFVGTIDPAELRRLSEQYLATLPSTSRTETVRDRGIERPAGIVTDTVRAGLDPVSQVAVIWHGTYPFSQETNFAIRTVERALEIRMQEVIREDESGTYGVGVQAQFSRVPRERYSILVTFRADPERVDDLTDTLLAVADELRSAPLDSGHVRQVTQTLQSGFEEGLTSNQFWASQIGYALRNARPMSAIMRYPDLVAATTAESILLAARRYLDEDQYIAVTLYPAESR